MLTYVPNMNHICPNKDNSRNSTIKTKTGYLDTYFDTYDLLSVNELLYLP